MSIQCATSIETIVFDFQHPKPGHAVTFTTENATFTSATTAVGYGTTFYTDQPENAFPVRYEFTFSTNSIHLDAYINYAATPSYTVAFGCHGTIQIT